MKYIGETSTGRWYFASSYGEAEKFASLYDSLGEIHHFWPNGVHVLLRH